MRDKALMVVVLSFLGGVYLRSYAVMSFALVAALAAIGALALLGALLVNVPLKQRCLFTGIIVLSLCAGIIRYEFSEHVSRVVEPYLSMPVSVEGVVIDEPDLRDTSTLLTIRIDSLEAGGETRALSEKVLIVAAPFPRFGYGDRLTLTGTIVLPVNFTTDTGREFDYRSYLAKDGIRYEMLQPKIALVEHGQGNPVMSALFDAKDRFISAVESAIPEPESSLLGGLVLGEKHSLGADITDSFRRAGIVHTIVLSGYNLTIVARALMWVFSFLPALASSFAGALGIVAFTLMTGASATAVRAAIMALLALLAKLVHRDYDIKRALFLAGFAMVLQNPKVLAFDPSFELSFLATLGLIYISPVLEPHLAWLTERFGLRDIISATLSTQIAVLPLLINLSGIVSLVGIAANILVLPTIPFAMLFGSITGAVAMLSSVLATPFAFVSYMLLRYEIVVASILGAFPFAAVSVPALPSWTIGAAYVMLVALVWRFHRRVDSAPRAAYASKPVSTPNQRTRKDTHDEEHQNIRAAIEDIYARGAAAARDRRVSADTHQSGTHAGNQRDAQ